MFDDVQEALIRYEKSHTKYAKAVVDCIYLDLVKAGQLGEHGFWKQRSIKKNLVMIIIQNINLYDTTDGPLSLTVNENGNAYVKMKDENATEKVPYKWGDRYVEFDHTSFLEFDIGSKKTDLLHYRFVYFDEGMKKFLTER